MFDELTDGRTIRVRFLCPEDALSSFKKCELQEGLTSAVCGRGYMFASGWDIKMCETRPPAALVALALLRDEERNADAKTVLADMAKAVHTVLGFQSVQLVLTGPVFRIGSAKAEALQAALVRTVSNSGQLPAIMFAASSAPQFALRVSIPKRRAEASNTQMAEGLYDALVAAVEQCSGLSCVLMNEKPFLVHS